MSREAVSCVAGVVAAVLAAAAVSLAQDVARDVRGTIEVGGLRRTYLLHLPPGYDPARPAPLVLAFHGGAGNADRARELSRLDETADRAGFILVYPEGTGRGEFLTWNAGNCCGYAARQQVDDVGFVRALLDDLAARYAIDPRRVYATGMSNGAMMCYRLAAELSDRIAAIAPVAGGMGVRGPRPPRGVPIVHFHGSADRHYPFDGGQGPDSIAGVDFISIPETIAWWAEADGCPAQPTVERLPDTAADGMTVRRETYAPGRDGAEIVLYVIEGQDHCWPGGPPVRAQRPPTRDISANDLLWAFFEAHPMPAR